MKNFTNNFKQFTSRLSARWLIMALMMLVGTSSAWGYYVTGWNGDWNPTQYNMGGANSYTINNVEAGTYEFKITDGSWNKTWGSGCLSSATGTASKIDNGDCGSDAKIEISTKSNVTIKFTCNNCYDKGGASIQVSATAVQVDPVNVTGYQLAGFNDWSNPITMTKNGDIYTCTKTLTAKTYTGGSNEAGFKIIENYSNSTQKWYGYTGTMTRVNCSNWAFSEGSNNNCGITADIAGTYTFTFDASTKNLSVTYPAQSYTITYNANGGDGAPDAQTKTHGTTLTLSSTIPTRTGYTFQNWNTASNGSGTTYKSGVSYTANAAATLYAQWTANTYTITYKDQGGAAFSGTHAAGAPTTHTYGAKTTLKDPTKSGYNFLGWFTKSDCSGTAVASLGATAYTADITLYAKWEKICVPATSITSAELQQNGTISLEGNFTTCGAKFHGFQWRKSTADWCNDGDESQDFSNYVKIGNTEGGEGEVKDFTPESGVTYVFRTYIYNNGSWVYSSETKEVSTCVSVVDPAVSMSPANGAVCQGYPVTLNLTTRQSGVVYKIGNEEIFESTTTYSFIPNTSSVTVTASSTSACAGTNNKTKEFSISIKSLPEAPVFESNSMTVCAGEPFTLPTPSNLKVGTEDCIWSVDGKTTTGNQPGISQTTVYTAVKNDGCPSPSEEITVNVTPKPIISISGSEDAVLYEDVTLTATATDAKTINWSITDGPGTLSNTTGTSVKLTSSTAGTVKVKATATSENGCTKESNELSVTFANETCNNVADMTKIYLDVSENTGFITGNNAYVSVTASGNNSANCDNTSGANQNNYVPKNDTWWGTMTKVAGENYIYEITIPNNVTINKGTTKLSFWNNRISGSSDVWEVQAILGQTISAGTNCMKLSNKTKTHNDDRHSHLYCGTWTTYKNAPAITAPAVKTVSATSDEDGNVTMVGQVVKTGCDTKAILGLQYKKQNPDGTTYEANYTTYPNPGTKEAISAGKTFTVTTKLEDGTYLVRARIDNSHATNGYGEDIKVVVNTTKTPISEVAIDYSDIDGNDDIDDPKPMCKGAIAYVKLFYKGSRYSDIKWLVEGVETNLVTDEGDDVWSYEIQGDGSLSVELKNDANTDPAWPYSNKLPFEIIPEPTAPYISINPASGIICQGTPATIKVENPSTDCSYKLVEEGSKAGFEPYKSGDLKYTVQNVGKYYVVAQHNACTDNEYTSNQVAINQIISTNANISIDPEEAVTTPWEPVTITVKPDAGYIYELTYTDGNLAAVDGVRIKQNGDSYTYYIPRPDSWGTGDSDPVRTPINYGIKAQLKVDGEASQCDLNAATATIQLKDEDNEDCPK